MPFSSEGQLLEIQSSTDNLIAGWEEPRDEKRKKRDTKTGRMAENTDLSTVKVLDDSEV